MLLRHSCLSQGGNEGAIQRHELLFRFVAQTCPVLCILVNTCKHGSRVGSLYDSQWFLVVFLSLREPQACE